MGAEDIPPSEGACVPGVVPEWCGERNDLEIWSHLLVREPDLVCLFVCTHSSAWLSFR